MNQITIKTDNAANARKLADFLKSIRYVKSVDLDDGSLKPLKGADWIKPGRPATDEELEKMCIEMEAEEGEYTTKEMKELAKQWKKKKSL